MKEKKEWKRKKMANLMPTLACDAKVTRTLIIIFTIIMIILIFFLNKN